MRRVVLFLFLGIQINGFAAEWDTIHITYADSVEAFFASAVPKALVRKVPRQEPRVFITGDTDGDDGNRRAK